MRTRPRVGTPLSRYVAVVCAVYAVLVLAGIHMSSIGALKEDDPSPGAVLYGTPRQIRSDEYLRSAPAQIGSRRFTRRAGTSVDAVPFTPLDSGYGASDLGVVRQPASPGSRDVSWVVNKILNLDSSISRRLPILQDFTATWWRGTLYLFVGMALLFAALGLTWPYALVASVMVWFSPANQWWSLWPLESTGVAALSAGLLLTALRQLSVDPGPESRVRSAARTGRAAVVLGVSVILGYRLPSAYQPWSVPVTAVLGAVSLGVLVRGRFNWRRMRGVLVLALVGVLLAGYRMVLHLRGSLQSILSTVYPGVRRFSGLTGYPRWGSALNWELQRQASNAVNQSEVAVGLVILIVPVIAALVVGRRSRDHVLYLPLLLGTSVISVFYMWTLVSWPHWMSTVLFLDRFPPDRTLQIIGVLIPVLYVMAVAFVRKSDVTDSAANGLALLVFLVVVVLTLQDGSIVRGILTWVSVGTLWTTAIVSAAVLSLPFIRRIHKPALVLLSAGAIFCGINVNPVMRGLGILGHSQSQRALAGAIRIDDRRWASDSMVIDPLAVAAGMRVLSGNQGSGPNRQAYHVLDPLELDADKWNRAGSYVTFAWTRGDGVVFTNPAVDVIQIQIDPCNPLLDTFDLAWVASSGDQPGHPCLRLQTMFPYQDMTIRLYRRTVTP